MCASYDRSESQGCEWPLVTIMSLATSLHAQMQLEPHLASCSRSTVYWAIVVQDRALSMRTTVEGMQTG